MVRLTGSCSGAESQLLSCGTADQRFTAATRLNCREGFDEVTVQCFSEVVVQTSKSFTQICMIQSLHQYSVQGAGGRGGGGGGGGGE